MAECGMDLAAEMAKLPEPPDGPWPHWDHWRLDLWARAQEDRPENFVTWPCIRHTMLCEHWVDQMQRRWEELPPRYMDAMSGLDDILFRNCIEQAYSLWQWETRTGLKVSDLDTIQEFGAGYGQMTWLCRRLGFTGWYCSLDLPEFQLLRKWWLGTQGIEDCAGRILHPDLFIGCYSVSEIPPRKRPKQLGNAAHYLLLYSGQFDKWDNRAWFARWQERMGREWQSWQAPDRPDWYAIC